MLEPFFIMLLCRFDKKLTDKVFFVVVPTSIVTMEAGMNHATHFSGNISYGQGKKPLYL